ncbi:hypothetical protein ACVCL0_08990 [Rhodanobacter sp. UC4450_H17]
MAHVSGTANTVTDLLAALRGACTANGWTLSGNVLSKSGVYVDAKIVDGAPLAGGTNFLSILGGTGIDGSNNLTGAGPAACYVGPVGSTPLLTSPINYDIHIHTSPDEVYMVASYSVEYYAWLAFGKSPAPGVPGTGVWYGATSSNQPRLNGNCNIWIEPTGVTQLGGAVDRPTSAALFWGQAATAVALYNSFIHHGWDAGWSGTNDNSVNSSAGSRANASGQLQPRMGRQPNTWNGESVLMPIQPSVARGSGWRSIAGSLAHARYIRIDNYAPGDIITLGTDRWRIYPWFRKFAGARDGGNNVTHSGTLGWAVRYDGP